jgi:phosphoesterase RecJ-like protein
MGKNDFEEYSQVYNRGYLIFARMNSADVAKVRELLSQSNNIVIVPHKNPDGDAIGSTLGLRFFLQQLGKSAQVIVPNDYPKFLKWMPGNDTILNFERQNSQAMEHLEKADLIFTLDFNHLSRTGQLEKWLEASKAQFIMIDHHQQPSDYAVVSYSDVSMSSTCEMVYNVIEAFNEVDAITKEIATCLYTGIMTDTGSFKYSSTTGRTHRVVAELIDKGANNMLIHQRVFDTNSPARLHLLGAALNNLVILEEYRTAFITLSQKELDEHHFSKGDTEGFVNYGLTLENIVFAVIFIENEEEGIIKISFRSVGDFSVNEFARAHFNGGGHTNAAGGRSTTSIEETVERFKLLLKDYQKQLLA